MKILTIVFFILVGILQYKLWFAPGGIRDVATLRQQVIAQRKKNDHMIVQDDQMIADVNDLKQGGQAIEERARVELGMIKENEEFYQFVQ